MLNNVLFEEYKYFNYKFPEPQYLGSKINFLSWIAQYLPDSVNTALDAFAGSQSVSYYFKQLGYQTVTNDFLNFNNQIGIALVENTNEQLDKHDIEILFGKSPYKSDYTLMDDVYTGIFFQKEDAEFIDNFRANIPRLKNKYKQALAFAAMNRSLTRKITMGHFGHTQALVYANNPERVKRNRSLIRPVKDLFLEILPQYNDAVFDNGQDNKSFNENILDLLPKLSNIDLVYFDPPYFCLSYFLISPDIMCDMSSNNITFFCVKFLLSLSKSKTANPLSPTKKSFPLKLVSNIIQQIKRTINVRMEAII